MILDERGFDNFIPWAQRAKDLLRAFGNPPSPTTEERWQEWGVALGLMASMPIIPVAMSYENWREWVQALNRTVTVQ